MTAAPPFERLTADECWRLVGARGAGRIAFAGDTALRVVPTRYDVDHATAYVRATTFGELARSVHGRGTTLQVDDVDPLTLTGWSVQLSGVAHRVEDAATVAFLWSLERPAPWSPGPTTQWLALAVDTIEGQRVS